MVTIFSAAYMAEVIRGGLAALPKGQYEAADALGLNYWQAQRLIIMPQALKIAIPGIVSIFIGLFKDTTLVSIIALADPMQWIKFIQANAEWNGVVWELYGFVAFVFFIFCFSMSRYSMYLERKLQTGH
ncbi:MAG TPA: amino acid ABC transporter permease, partial [Rhodobacteraceae bacterium]|nr:amino acid ABC transporter permease [Paracoccaceae bacterium]